MPSEAPDPRPRLEVVGEGARSGQGAGREPDARAARRGFWVLAVLLIAAAVALGVQTRRVGELDARVQELEAELGAARGEIAAYERQLGLVRGLVDDLGDRLEALREAVNRDPGEAPSGAEGEPR